MQIDMHFYGIYALARSAGIKSETAHIIAQASQFVDDAIDANPILVRDQNVAILPIMTSHTPLDLKNNSDSEDQWRVWVCFHFLPGNDRNANSLEGRLVCGKDSALARAVLNHALANKAEAFGPHLAGVVAHVFADTFAHYGFMGITSGWNKVKDNSIDLKINAPDILEYVKEKSQNFRDTLLASAAGKALPLGHAGVATFPDRPYLEWEYEYTEGNRPRVVRQNLNDFLEAAEKLHAFFAEFVRENPKYASSDRASSWDAISGRIRNVLQEEAQLPARIKSWKELITGSALFVSDDRDKAIDYSEKEWSRDSFDQSDRSSAEVNFSLFVKAARMHQYFVLNQLLPENGLVF